MSVSSRTLATLLFSVGRLLRDRALEGGASISYLHVATLQYVAEQKRPLMREVAHYLRIAPPSATSLVSTLVAQGDLRRIANKDDRRTVRLEVTAKGHRTIEDCVRHKHDVLQKVVSQLSERDRVDLAHILEKVIHLSEK